MNVSWRSKTYSCPWCGPAVTRRRTVIRGSVRPNPSPCLLCDPWPLEGNLLELAQVDLAGGLDGQLLDLDEVVSGREPEFRQRSGGQALVDLRRGRPQVCVDHDQPLAPPGVGQRGDGHRLLVHPGR